MDRAESFRKMADCVDALRDVEGVEVDEADLAERPTGGATIGHLFGTEQMETEQVICITLTIDEEGPGQEIPDDGDDDRESVEVNIEGAPEP